MKPKAIQAVEEQKSAGSVCVFATQHGCCLQDYTQCFQSVAVFNQKWYSQLNAILNLIRTLFVTFALGFAMIIFNKDAQRLVLRPIERMLRKVKEVSENPLSGRANSKIKVSRRPHLDGSFLGRRAGSRSPLTRVPLCGERKEPP